jgi:hypothetical protein
MPPITSHPIAGCGCPDMVSGRNNGAPVTGMTILGAVLVIVGFTVINTGLDPCKRLLCTAGGGHESTHGRTPNDVGSGLGRSVQNSIHRSTLSDSYNSAHGSEYNTPGDVG